MATGCEAQPPAASYAHTSVCPDTSQDALRQTYLLAAGRYPTSDKELAAHLTRADPVASALVDLLADARVQTHWAAWLRDRWLVPAQGLGARPSCTHRAHLADAPAELAHFVASHDPTEAWPQAFGLVDLVRAAIKADDMRAVLRFQPVVAMAAPFAGANVEPETLEASRRDALAQQFEAVMLGQAHTCANCHAYAGGTTDHVDPALDRWWPLRADLEPALWGGATTRERAFAPFRVQGVWSDPTAPNPQAHSAWGNESCGRLADPTGEPTAAAYLGGEWPTGGGALELSRRLATGLDALALRSDVSSGAPLSPDEGLALAVTQTFVDDLWFEATGANLRLPHGAPRNAWQREELLRITNQFVTAQYSFQSLLAAVLQSPYLRESAPADCDQAQSIPAIFDPFVDDPSTGNTPANALHPVPPRTRLRATLHAFGWPQPDESSLQLNNELGHAYTQLGIPLSSANQGGNAQDLMGSLAWEHHFASGQRPAWIDAAGPDWIDQALAAAVAQDISVQELAEELHERFAIEGPVPGAAFELMGVAASQRVAELDAATLDAAARRLAGALVLTPQFTLAGVPVQHGAVGRADVEVP